MTFEWMAQEPGATPETRGAPGEAAAVSALSQSEVPITALMVTHVETPGKFKANVASLFLTNERLLFVPGKLFGKAKVRHEIRLDELSGGSVDPLHGVGPTWAMRLRRQTGPDTSFYFHSPHHAVEFESLVRRAAEERRSTSERAEPQPIESHEVSPEERARFARLHDLVDDLRPLATNEMVGRPFGEGSGLEDALPRVRSRLLSADDCRECGRLVMTGLLGEERANPASLTQVMGESDLGSAAGVLLAQFAAELINDPDEPRNMLDLWVQRDDVAAEMLAWHIVAHLRLAAAGIVEAPQRPAWA